MPFIPAANTVRSALIQGGFGQSFENVLWFLLTSGITDVILGALNDALEAWWVSNIVPRQSNQVGLTQILSTDQSSSSGNTVIKNVSHAGSQSAASLPLNDALVITFLTGHRGRSFRGRTYFAGNPVSFVDTGNSNAMLSSPMTSLVAAFATLDASLAGVSGTPQHVVVSHFANKAARGAALCTPVTAYSANVFLDSQRRRLTGRGR